MQRDNIYIVTINDNVNIFIDLLKGVNNENEPQACQRTIEPDISNVSNIARHINSNEGLDQSS